MCFIECECPIVKRCLIKYGDSELVVFRLELEDGRFFYFKTFDCLIKFIKINL